MIPHNEYAANFFIVGRVEASLFRECMNCGVIDLEAAGVEMRDDSVRVGALRCKHWIACQRHTGEESRIKLPLAKVPVIKLRDYCHGCEHCGLEAKGVELQADIVSVSMLLCQTRAACEHQRRLIAAEAQRRAYERARFEDERRAAVSGGE